MLFGQFGQGEFSAALFASKSVKEALYLATPNIERNRIGIENGAIDNFTAFFLFHGSTAFRAGFLFEQEIP